MAQQSKKSGGVNGKSGTERDTDEREGGTATAVADRPEAPVETPAVEDVKPPEAAPTTVLAPTAAPVRGTPPTEPEDEVDPVQAQLQAAVQNALDEIKQIREQRQVLDTREQALQQMLRNIVPAEFREEGDEPLATAPKPAAVSKPPANKTAPSKPAPKPAAKPTSKPAGKDGGEYMPTAGSKSALIIRYIGDNKEARTKDIKTYLGQRGVSDNPGVELTRLVERDVVRNKDRGIYDLTNKGVKVYRALGGKKQ
jgi:hypothetical protein